MKCSRRDLCLLLPAAAISPRLSAQRSSLLSRAYRYEDLPVRTNGKNRFRAILDGKTRGDIRLETHETELAPGERPHPPHRHLHEELFLVREGTVEVTINGQRSRLGPGSAAFMASNDEHGIRNVGTTPAQYFVVALGTDEP